MRSRLSALSSEAVRKTREAAREEKPAEKAARDEDDSKDEDEDEASSDAGLAGDAALPAAGIEAARREIPEADDVQAGDSESAMIAALIRRVRAELRRQKHGASAKVTTDADEIATMYAAALDKGGGASLRAVYESIGRLLEKLFVDDVEGLGWLKGVLSCSHREAALGCAALAVILSFTTVRAELTEAGFFKLLEHVKEDPRFSACTEARTATCTRRLITHSAHTAPRTGTCRSALLLHSHPAQANFLRALIWSGVRRRVTAWSDELMQLIVRLIPCYYGAELALARAVAPDAPTTEQRGSYAHFVAQGHLLRSERMSKLFVEDGPLNEWFGGSPSTRTHARAHTTPHRTAQSTHTHTHTHTHIPHFNS